MNTFTKIMKVGFKVLIESLGYYALIFIISYLVFGGELSVKINYHETLDLLASFLNY